MRKIFKGSDSELAIISDRRAADGPALLNLATLRTARQLLDATPRPQSAIIVGKLENIRRSTQTFALTMDDGQGVRCVMLEADVACLTPLFQQSVAVSGRAVFRARAGSCASKPHPSARPPQATGSSRKSLDRMPSRSIDAGSCESKETSAGSPRSSASGRVTRLMSRSTTGSRGSVDPGRSVPLTIAVRRTVAGSFRWKGKGKDRPSLEQEVTKNRGPWDQFSRSWSSAPASQWGHSASDGTGQSVAPMLKATV